MASKKTPDRASADAAPGTPAKPVLDSVIDAVAALSELAKSLRARARESADRKGKGGKKKGGAKDKRAEKKSAKKADDAVSRDDASEDAETPAASDGVKRRLKRAWKDLTAPEPGRSDGDATPCEPERT